MMPDVTVRGFDGQFGTAEAKKQCEKLRLQVTRALENADYLMENLLMGEFPNHAQISKDVSPFGLKTAAHTEYKNATERKKNSESGESPWHDWLKSTFKDYLHAHSVQKAQSFCGFSKSVQGNKRLDDFASGHSHLW